MQSTKNPELRFKKKGGEEYEDWEEKKLSTCLDYEQPNDYIVENTNYNNKYDIPVLTAGKSFILGYTNEQEGIFKNVPVVIFDDFTTSIKYVDFNFKVKSSAMKILKAKKGFNLKFIYESMNRIKFSATEHKRYWISTYQDLKIPLPSMEEQEKIAGCLSSLDRVIEKGEEETKKLKEYKKGLMQKLFSRELRFKKANGEEYADWEEKKLGEVAEVVRGGSPRPISKYLTNAIDGVNWLKIADTQAVRKYIYTTKERIKDTGVKYSREVKEGDFILSNSMSFGRPFIMACKACIHDGWVAIKNINILINKDYIFYFMLSETAQVFFHSVSSGSTVQNLSVDKIKDLKIQLPSMEEQEKIAGCLSSLDRVIEKGEEETKNLKEYKKGLMQKLFPKG